MFAALMNQLRARNVLPRISETERQALEAGTVWIDGEIFSGNPDFSRMLREPYNALSEEEQAFLDGPTETLCRMLDVPAIQHSRRVPEDALQYLKEQGFMGLLIPREYGGKGFSTLAISTIMAKVNSYSSTVGTFVVIPNSLGAGELLQHYGTEAQKTHYLPRLASGEYVPCFGLTEPGAGSDAASIQADGEVFRDAEGNAAIRLNFEKRYITLAPVANLISLAFQLRDPDDLLGRGTEPGITVALLHSGTPGLEQGEHHMPVGEGFYNGPLRGRDVETPAEQIIGGVEGAGQGWRMLMEQLAGGRAVSLPASAIGGIKTAAAVTGPYSMIRHQFGIPIGQMEGIQDRVARIAAMAYLFEGARVYSCSALDGGEQPPVISALMKSSSTDAVREALIDGMDVFSGAAVMQGPNNILATAYHGAPVGITVEGANIMTRTLIVFGQGATRCHPHALPVVRAVEADDVATFRRELLGWLGHTAGNWLRTRIRSLTRGHSAGSPVAGPTATYYRRLAWAASRFALLADLAMFSQGSRLKARGNLSGRFADALTWQVLALSTLRRFEAEGRRDEDLPLVAYACEHALAKVQEAFEGIHANFDRSPLGWWLRKPAGFMLRINPLSHGPDDGLVARAAATIQSHNEQYHRVTCGIARPPETTPGAGRLLHAFRLREEVRPLLERIHAAQRARTLSRGIPWGVLDEAEAAGTVTATEAQQLRQARDAGLAAIQVDTFSPADYFGDHTVPTEHAEGRRAAG